MVDLKQFKGICLHKHDGSPEANQIHLYSILNGIEMKRTERKHSLGGYVPTGSVEYCESMLGFNVKPDYYPEWLHHKLGREVFKSNEWIMSKKMFVKPSDRYKRFNGFVTNGGYKGKKKPPYIYSEVVSFVDEFRYYISKGQNKGGWWYQGANEDMKAPELDFGIPCDYSGALDMGTTKNGDFLLVESQHPFACGWYGPQEEIETYLQWIIDGWELMVDLKLDHIN